MTPVEIDSLPLEYQKVLAYGQEQYSLDVLLLEQLKGGRTAAHLYLSSVIQEGNQKPKHFVLKIDRIHKLDENNEITLHKRALDQAPGDFSRAHIADLNFVSNWEDCIALFYDIAGGSLLEYHPLAYYENQEQLETIFRRVNKLVLDEWNTKPGFERAVHPQELLERWLGYRLTPQGYIRDFFVNHLQIDPDIPGFLIDGKVYPNPFLFSRKKSLWGSARCIDIICGHQHGDLNLGNVLVRFGDKKSTLDGIYLIDFSLYADKMPLLYDLRYLEMSYFLCELDRSPIHKLVDLFTRYADEDTPLTNLVSVEFAGACGVINAGRITFQDWLHSNYAGLIDDLRGQFWLAGVAAGLNFGNKRGLSTPERLAGLIYAAAHLKRYFSGFGIKLPVRVTNLFDRDYPAERIQVPGWDTAVTGTPAGFAGSPSSSLSARYLPDGGETLVGRKSEIAAVSDILQENRLVTLNGPGGIGKTRLALAVADKQRENFRHGVYFVPLLPVRSPSGIVPAVAGTLGMSFLEGRSPQTQLVDYLKARRMLLVLDNLEQLLDAGKSAETTNIVETILVEAPDIKLLVTSRELLRLNSERAFTVEGLPVSEQEDFKKISGDSAVDLFRVRVKKVNPSFELGTVESYELVKQFCRKVEGMPLAIELAAAQLRLMSLEDIIKQVEADLDVLDSGMRGAKSRHASINVVFESSWQLLTIEEQKIFPRLSVFRGGFTLEAALRIAHTSLTEISQLIDKSLIARDADNRYTLHALIQTFAAQKLVETPGELSSTLASHFQYYRDRLHEAVLRWQESADTSLIDSLKPEVDNLRTAWMWIVGLLDWDQTAGYSEDMWHFYKVLGRLPEAVEMLQEAVRVGCSEDYPASPVYMARWERHIGQAYLWLSQFDEGDEYLQRSLSYLDWSLPRSRAGLVLGLVTQVILQVAHRFLPGFLIGRAINKQGRIREAYIAYEHITMRAGIESDTFVSAYCGIRSLNLAEAAGLHSEMARAYTSTGYMIGLVPIRGIAEWYLKRSRYLLQKEYTVESDMWISLLSGYYYFGVGELSAAEESFQQTATLAGEIGKHWEKENAWIQIFIIALLKGEWNRCLEYVELIEVSAQKRGDAGYLAAVIYWKATVELFRSDADDVIPMLEESCTVPDEAMMVFDWLALRSALAIAYLRQGDEQSAAMEAEEIEKLIAGISRPSGSSYVFGYAGTARVYLGLAEIEADALKRNEFMILAKQACKRLHSFARIFPVTSSQAWLYQGKHDWLSGKPVKARQAWDKSLACAVEMDIPYQQGLAHYEIGSHLKEDELAQDGGGARDHLRSAYQIFKGLDSFYDLNRTVEQLKKLGVEQ